jgi:UDP-N-acetylglucosamine 2-epimerase (non-hydrolysing)
MLDQVLEIFSIKPDIDLDIMMPNQDLTTLTSRLLVKLGDVLGIEKPDIVLAQGDTTTVLTVALSCFYNHITFGHIEAGLRTGDMGNPFPEEMNRVVASRLAHWHFAPTETARQNLLREGVTNESIHMTGNTVIDALMMVSSRSPDIGLPLPDNKRLILVTAHRRESFGEPIKAICQAIRTLADRNEDVHILYPVHPNPNVHNVVWAMLNNHERITLCDPLDYVQFVAAMKQSYLILSDSGGVQEEAPALGKPVLVLRQETERQEAIDCGVVKLVGMDCTTIVIEAQKLLDDVQAYRALARGVSPYGDGHAAEKIVNILIGTSSS